MRGIHAIELKRVGLRKEVENYSEGETNLDSAADSLHGVVRCVNHSLLSRIDLSSMSSLAPFVDVHLSNIGCFLLCSSMDTSKRLQTMSNERTHNLEHRVFQLQRMADSRGSLQSSRTTLKDFIEPQLRVSAQM